MTPLSLERQRRAIAWWLLIVAAMIFVMVVLGGTTRLTRSGLSIVEWRLLAGTLPPLSETHWHELFDQYQLTPEYRKVNVGMSLEGFKEIFWLEYLHRLWGRLIFFVALVPLAWFLWRRQIGQALIPRLVAVPLLVAANGVLGWLMVASGLIDLPRVSPYRLTAHLGLAVAIYGYILWLVLDLLYSETPAGEAATAPTQTTERASEASRTPESARGPRLDPIGETRRRQYGVWVTALIFVMILTGGLVAGTRAGFSYNTFPLMGEGFFPVGVFALEPWWINFFENVATVQLNHRLLAYLLMFVIPVFWWVARRRARTPRLRWGIHLLLVLFIIQFMLGVGTLLYVVPVPLAAAHQAGALALFTLALYITHGLRRVA